LRKEREINTKGCASKGTYMTTFRRRRCVTERRNSLVRGGRGNRRGKGRQTRGTKERKRKKETGKKSPEKN
jgi:hypothetical protein